MKRLVALSLCLLTACPTAAVAGACATPAYKAASYYKPAAVVADYAAYIALVPAVFVPAAGYSVGVLPAAPVAAAAPAAAPAADAGLRQELEALRAELNALKAAPPPAAAAAPAADPFARAVTNNCLSCHGEKRQEGGLSLAGEWSADVSARVAREVFTGHMPKGRQMSPADRQALAEKLFPKK